MSNLIGFALTAIGGILFATTEFIPFVIIMLIGVFLFASLPAEDIFCDYIIANSNAALLRKRYYKVFLPFAIMSYILTLGRAILKLLWKEEYYTAAIEDGSVTELTNITRKQYIAIRNYQRQIYTTQTLSKEFMSNTYSVQSIGLKRKKSRLIITSILAVLMFLMLVEPDGYYLTIIYNAIFIPMIILWIPEYKDAKILQQAYDRAMSSDS